MFIMLFCASLKYTWNFEDVIDIICAICGIDFAFRSTFVIAATVASFLIIHCVIQSLQKNGISVDICARPMGVIIQRDFLKLWVASVTNLCTEYTNNLLRNFSELSL